MARVFAKKFYNSKAWKSCRAAYIAERVAIDGGLCETCGLVPGLIVHHTVWLTEDNVNDPDIALLRYDCQACHNRESEDGSGDRCIIGPDGQPVEVRPPPLIFGAGWSASRPTPLLGKIHGSRTGPPPVDSRAKTWHGGANHTARVMRVRRKEVPENNRM